MKRFFLAACACLALAGPAAATGFTGLTVEPPGAGTNTVVCSLNIKATATACGAVQPHNVNAYIIDNTGNSAASYVQVFNLATGSVTLGTTAPLFSIPVPANSAINLALPYSLGLTTALSVACTTTATGSSAPSANCGITMIGN